MEWISVEDRLPEAKTNWNHSDQVAVFYPPTEYDTSALGIAYYNYEPPFEEKPRFVDFQRYTRQPMYWMPLPEPPKS